MVNTVINSLVTPTNTLIVALLALGVALTVIVRLLVRIDELWEYVEILERQNQQHRLEEFTKGLKIGKHLTETQEHSAAIRDGWYEITMPTLARIEQAKRETAEGGEQS